MQANELKRLQNTLGIAESELRKVREQYAECNKYCAFLDSITPPEFFQEQAARYEAEWQVPLCSVPCHWVLHNELYSKILRALLMKFPSCSYRAEADCTEDVWQQPWHTLLH